MKQTIKNFFTKKRFKNVLKNNKGFSLLEVLVGVSIIGIISAIAVPTFQNYQRKARIAAGQSSLKNLVKGHVNCLVLSDYASCDGMDGNNSDLAEIDITCPECTVKSTATHFCAEYKVDDFSGCISKAIANTTAQMTLGGQSKICYLEKSTLGVNEVNNPVNVPTGKTFAGKWTTDVCQSDSNCTGYSVTGFNAAGKCGSAAGTCNSTGECQ